MFPTQLVGKAITAVAVAISVYAFDRVIKKRVAEGVERHMQQMHHDANEMLYPATGKRNELQPHQ